ncbi:hypothetical protein BC938DRAFT_476632 [Jimgerdemannia flammicorona]|uniref:P-type ATPase C-terminal domain-containing protein n=1 Tax=Jimgerdemannia flammicorona TaxID=994334 RepID=A0A433QQA7_9FUNG|nr:hypothetical protein BC938DRAFT_476632 [Jimgerdemannia flammicorona]
MFDYSFIMLFNLMFTSLPCIFLGVFDQDLSAEVSLAYPQLYMMGLRNEKFTTWRFWLHVVDALYQSAVCFFIPYFMFLGAHINANGYDSNGVIELGTVIAAIAVVVANGYVGITIFSWTWLMGIVIVASIGTYFIWTAVFSQFNTFLFLGEDILFGEVSFWLCLVVTFVIAMLPRYAFKVYLHQYYPLDNDIIRELVICKNLGTETSPEDEQPITRNASLHTETSTAGIRRHSSSATTASETFTLEDHDKSDHSIAIPTPIPTRPPFSSGRTPSFRSDQVMYMRSGKRMSFTGFAFSSDDESVFDSFRKSVYRPKNAMSHPDLHFERNSISEERPLDHLNQDWMMLRPIRLTRSESAPAKALDPKRAMPRSGLKGSLVAAVAGIGSAVAGVGGLGPAYTGPSSSQSLTAAALEAMPIVTIDPSQDLGPVDPSNSHRKVRFATLRGLVNPRRLSNISAASDEGSVVGWPVAVAGSTARSSVLLEPSVRPSVEREEVEVLMEPMRIVTEEEDEMGPAELSRRRNSVGVSPGGTDITEMRDLVKEEGGEGRSID